MLFDKTKDPAACCPKPKDSNRYSVTGVLAIQKGDKTYLAATDGKVLSLIRTQATVETEQLLGDDKRGIVPPEAIAAARKATPKTVAETCVNVDTLASGSDRAMVREKGGAEQSWPCLQDTRFPDVFAVIPDKPVKARIALDTKLLAKLAKSFGTETIVLELHEIKTDKTESSLPVTIRPLFLVHKGQGDDGSFGVMMPVSG